ncbi:MAG: hypothetical protein GOU99_03050 [Candidatus Altiarchaeota archaeon]|nr:hypothetical protein [Candidatus Altiarchaeota archaeon]
MSAEWKLKSVQNAGQTEMQDAHDRSFLLSPEFLELMSEQVKSNERFKTRAIGLQEIVNPLGIKKSGGKFYVLRIRTVRDKVRLLFELLPGEYSRLVGMDQTSLDKEDLKKILLDAVYGGEIEELEMLI